MKALKWRQRSATTSIKWRRHVRGSVVATFGKREVRIQLVRGTILRGSRNHPWRWMITERVSRHRPGMFLARRQFAGGFAKTLREAKRAAAAASLSYRRSVGST